MTTNPQDLQYTPTTASLREGSSLVVRIGVLRRQAAFSLYLHLMPDGGEPRPIPMAWLGLNGNHDEYEASLADLTPGLYWVWFEQDVCGDRFSFGKESPWQLTVYRRDYETPRWYEAGVTYHIFVDRFHRAGLKPTPKEGRLFRFHEDWYEQPDLYAEGELEQNFDFFGGNLLGIEEKLDYLQSLGVATLYLSPLFEAASNHRYDTGDYHKVDPVAGDEEDLRSLCRSAGERGIRVILDVAFSHTGSDSRYFNARGLYDSLGASQSLDSPYASWYRFRHWPDDYECWWGVKTLPQVNELDPRYLKFTLEDESSVIRHWFDVGVSGYRLDVADELPAEYLERLRAAVKAVKPDGLIIGEVWEDATTKVSYGERRRYLQGRELDGVMNYPARDAILRFVKSELDAPGLADALMALHRNVPGPARHCMMNVLGTHDTARTINVLGAAPEVFALTKQERASRGLTEEECRRGREALMLASALQYMLPGSPCLYYGDEAGMSGFEDPLNRRGYPWGREDNELLNWYRTLGLLRKQHADQFCSEELVVNAMGNDAVTISRKADTGFIMAIVNRGSLPLPMELPTRAEMVAGRMESGAVPPRSAAIWSQCS